MTSDASTDVQSVFDALHDPDCRAILSTLDEPRTAKEIADRCDLPQTSTYRKLDTLSEADLVDEQTAVRPDGHHATTYVRDVDGLVVTYDDGVFDVDVVERSGESPDERLARFWSEISDEL